MYNLKEIRKNFDNFIKSIKRRPVDINFDLLKKLDKENRDFHCSLLQNPDCLGAWINCYNSCRMQRHIYLLEELIWRLNTQQNWQKLFSSLRKSRCT